MKYYFSIALLLFAGSAQAFSVKNLDNVPHTIEVTQGGTNITTYTVQPGRTLRLHGGNGRIRMAGSNERFMRAFYVDIFTIWEGGVLHRQMRQKQRAH